MVHQTDVWADWREKERVVRKEVHKKKEEAKAQARFQRKEVKRQVKPPFVSHLELDKFKELEEEAKHEQREIRRKKLK